MLLTYKFRLYPSKQQEEKMLFVLDKCRFIYNQMLAGLNKQFKPDRLELQALLPQLKEKFPELNDVYSKVLQYEGYRLFSNLRSLGRLKKNGKKVGKLRYKGKEWFKTFTYNQSGFKIESRSRRFQVLYLSKIGSLPIRMHRCIKGGIKQVTVKKHKSGKWFAYFCVAQELKILNKPLKRAVGLDLGLNHFIMDSGGNDRDHPHCLSKSLNRLKLEQQRLAKKIKGSNNWEKQRIKVAVVHEKVLNQRNDFLHKLSKQYVDDYDFISVENLNVKGLIGLSFNAKNILDASWSKFLQLLEYKAVRAGVHFVRVEPRGTTQECSKCSKIVKKELWQRIHQCPYCGFTADRDLNASLNILKRGLKKLGQGLSFKPVETEPLSNRNVGQVQSTKQEAAEFIQ